jgi:hypothetical protein
MKIRTLCIPILLSCASLASAQIIDLEKWLAKPSGKTQKEPTKTEVEETQVDPSGSVGIDFTADFDRAIEGLRSEEKPVNSRYRDDVGVKRADRFLDRVPQVPRLKVLSQKVAR